MGKIWKSRRVILVVLFSISSVRATTITGRLSDGHEVRLGIWTVVREDYAGEGGGGLGIVN